MSSNHDGNFYCVNCFNSYTTKNELKENEEICNNHDSYHLEMPKQAEKILKYIHGEKSLKAPFTGYLDLECLLKKRKILPKYYEILCEKLKKRAMKIINYEKRK